MIFITRDVSFGTWSLHSHSLVALLVFSNSLVWIHQLLLESLWNDSTSSPRGKLNEEASHSGAEDQLNSYNGVGTSNKMKRAELNNTIYFIIKSLNHQNIQLSIKKGIWATQVMNEPILEEAFLNSSEVILIFSVSMSGFFQGYAQMISSVGWRRDNIWSQGSGNNNPWGRSFKVKWPCLHDLPFQSSRHLKNPWNDYKPVKISRDYQELPQDIGEALCDLDQGNTMVASLKRDEFSGDDFPQRRPYIETLYYKQDKDFNVPLVHMAPCFIPLYCISINLKQVDFICSNRDPVYLINHQCFMGRQM